MVPKRPPTNSMTLPRNICFLKIDVLADTDYSQGFTIYRLLRN